MTTYNISNIRTGVDIGTYETPTEDQALDAMAQEAGYRDYADLLARVPGSSRGELAIEEKTPSAPSEH